MSDSWIDLRVRRLVDYFADEFMMDSLIGFFIYGRVRRWLRRWIDAWGRAGNGAKNDKDGKTAMPIGDIKWLKWLIDAARRGDAFCCVYAPTFIYRLAR